MTRRKRLNWNASSCVSRRMGSNTVKRDPSAHGAVERRNPRTQGAEWRADGTSIGPGSRRLSRGGRAAQRIRCIGCRLRQLRELGLYLGNVDVLVRDVAFLIDKDHQRQRKHAHFVGESTI